MIRHVWDRFGDAAPGKLFGDWAFAAWDPGSRTLFLARDHCGNTALYYHASRDVFAFASSRRALLGLTPGIAELDELLLAKVLVSWPPRADDRTMHAPIKRLLPAHWLTVTSQGLELRPYWRLEDTPELRLSTRADYVEAFCQVFDRAVLDCLSGEGPTASTLSGGLDSGAVTITAARLLGERGQRLAAFTSVPLFDVTTDSPQRFGNELPFARATAAAAANIDLHAVDSAGASPVIALREMLDATLTPQHSAANLYWISALCRSVSAAGCRTLLTGQMGNAGMSWGGDVSSQPLAFQVRRLGVAGWLRRAVRRRCPPNPITTATLRRTRQRQLDASAIRSDFARRINLLELWLDEPAEPVPHAAPFRRRRILQQNLAGLGAFYAEAGTAAGLTIRDPSNDPRLLQFALSVPDRIFIDPATGLNRWLIRVAMKGRLPDAVRLNRRRGRQAADIVPRLRAAAGDMEEALSALAGGPAAAYVDVPRLRAAWDRVRTDDSAESAVLAMNLLMRGVMAGLFVNGFGTRW